jgi:hypothetical protein
VEGAAAEVAEEAAAKKKLVLTQSFSPGYLKRTLNMKMDGLYHTMSVGKKEPVC